MNVIETRLTGRQATLDGITRFINLQLGSMTLARVELRYSTQAEHPLPAQQAKQNIANLLRESGMGAVAVSVRAHEGLLDDATGEHVLRLFPLKVAAKSAGAAAPVWLPKWSARLLARFSPAGALAQQPQQQQGDQTAATSVAGSNQAASAQGAKPANPQAKPGKRAPGLSNAEVVGHLRRALALSANYIETASGTALVGAAPAEAERVIGQAHVIVRQENLHQVLQALIATDLVQAAQSIGGMLKTQGLTLAKGFAVSYAFEARKCGDGTAYASEADLQVVLRLAGAAAATPAAAALVKPINGPLSEKVPVNVPVSEMVPVNAPPVAALPPTPAHVPVVPAVAVASAAPAEVAPEPAPTPECAAAPATAPEPGRALPAQATLMPAPEVWRAASDAATLLPASPPQTLVLVRVLGTLQKDFDEAIELRFDTLPARFDRAALQGTGFAAEHGALLAVASNSCPLIIARADDGGLCLQASMRKVAGGGELAMYYLRDTLAALAEETVLPEAGLQLVVNVPGGVHDPVGGRTLPALVVEIMSGTSAGARMDVAS